MKQILFVTQGLSPEEIRAKGAKADEVHRRLVNTPVTFDELMASESEENMAPTPDGIMGPIGITDTMGLQVFGQAFINELFTMDVGDISEPIRSPIGYHIVEITRKESAQLLPMDDPQVRTALVAIVKNRKQQEAFDIAAQELADEIRETCTVRYLGDYADWK